MKQRCLPRHTFAVSHSQAADREQSLLCCNHLLSPPEPRQGLGLSLAQCSCFGADAPLDPNENPVLLLRYGQHCSVFKTQILMGNCSSRFLTRGNMAQLVVISVNLVISVLIVSKPCPWWKETSFACLLHPEVFLQRFPSRSATIKPATQQEPRNEARGTVAAGAGWDGSKAAGQQLLGLPEIPLSFGLRNNLAQFLKPWSENRAP